jgi:hypothetical protein
MNPISGGAGGEAGNEGRPTQSSCRSPTAPSRRPERARELGRTRDPGLAPSATLPPRHRRRRAGRAWRPAQLGPFLVAPSIGPVRRGSTTSPGRPGSVRCGRPARAPDRGRVGARSRTGDSVPVRRPMPCARGAPARRADRGAAPPQPRRGRSPTGRTRCRRRPDTGRARRDTRCEHAPFRSVPGQCGHESEASSPITGSRRPSPRGWRCAARSADGCSGDWRAGPLARRAGA